MSARATAKNRHGLHRRIPAAVEREVRQRCKFGCVICRAGFYGYHHIGTAQLLLGGLRYSPAVRVLLRYRGTPLNTVTPGTGGRPGAINAVFTDAAGNPTLRLADNRWVGPTEAWDIKVERARIQVQTAPGRPVLCLRLEPPGTLVAEQLDMRFKNAHVLANEHAYAVGRYLPDGRIFWFTAHVVIPASHHANGAVIEFMTPAQAARQLQSGLATLPGLRTGNGIFGLGGTAGAIHVPQGIAIASRCGELQVYGVAAGVRPIEEMRQVSCATPKQRLCARGR